MSSPIGGVSVGKCDLSATLTVAVERWPIAGRFTIARGAKTEAAVVVAELAQGDAAGRGAMAEGRQAVARGRGECVPYARYGESVGSVVAAIEAMAPALAAGLSRQRLRAAMPPGAARNAIDCALIDLEAKLTGRSAAALLGLPEPQPLTTAFTLGLGTPDAMRAAAERAADRPLLKVKLGAAGDPERIRAVRAGAPGARLIADANEGWTADNLAENIAACADAGVELIEQPLPAAADALLAGIAHPVPLCADESLHVGTDLRRILGRYEAVNIKLDKTGGLTEALALAEQTEGLGVALMVGCMVGTSLAMAPAILLAQRARYVDLDGPLLLARDREPGLVYRGSTVEPPQPTLWG